jgi:hypothetical protein
MADSEYRLGYAGCRSHLAERLAEPAPGRIQLLTGPRQVGKTTLLLELARRLGEAALYGAADAPEAALPGWWERLWQQGEDRARKHGSAVLLLDEIQHLAGWSGRLKASWDAVRRRGAPLHVVATGSSALRLGAGARERMTGRFERLTLAHWQAGDLAAAFDLEPGEAARVVVREGAYPGAVPLRADRARWRAYLRDAIIEPALGRDLLALGVIRKPALLRQVFAAAATSPCQVVSLQKLQGALQDPGALETIAHYLQLLEEAYLVAPLEKFAQRDARRRAAPPKLVVLSNALLAAGDPRGAPDASDERARFGAWVENACLAHAWNTGQRVRYWREEPLDVDAVLEGSWGAWALEVKTGQFVARDLAGLFEFTRRHPRFRPLVVGDRASRETALHAGAAWVSWEQFLLAGPPREKA